MARKLTEKQRAFTLRVFETKEDPGPVYLSIYAVKSMAVASAAASRLLTNVKVQELLEELQQKAEDDSVAGVLERKQVLTEVVRGRFADFMTKLTPDKLKSAALQEIKITEFTGGKEGRAREKSTTIKLHNPMQAIDLLNKMDKIYTDETEDKSVKVQVNILNVDTKAVAAAILEAERLGLSPGLLGGDVDGEDASVLPSQPDV